MEAGQALGFLLSEAGFACCPLFFRNASYKLIKKSMLTQMCHFLFPPVNHKTSARGCEHFSLAVERPKVSGVEMKVSQHRKAQNAEDILALVSQRKSLLLNKPHLDLSQLASIPDHAALSRVYCRCYSSACLMFPCSESKMHQQFNKTHDIGTTSIAIKESYDLLCALYV